MVHRHAERIAKIERKTKNKKKKNYYSTKIKI